MSAAAAWRWCLAAGLIAFACSIAFGRIPGLIACGPTGGLGPILAFELARTPAEITALFGTEPCRATLVDAQRTGLWLDALGFIPSYTAFLCLAAIAAGGHRARRLVAVLLAAAVCDEVEGGLLFATLRDLPGTPATLGLLFWAVRAKFLLLALGTLAIGLLILGRRRVVPVLLGLGVTIGALRALAGFGSPGMMAGFTIGWFALLLAAAIGAVWPRLLAPRPPVPAPPSA